MSAIKKVISVSKTQTLMTVLSDPKIECNPNVDDCIVSGIDFGKSVIVLSDPKVECNTNVGDCIVSGIDFENCWLPQTLVTVLSDM